MLRLPVLAGLALIGAAALSPAEALPLPRPDAAAAVQPAGGRWDDRPARPHSWGWGYGDPRGRRDWGPMRPPHAHGWGWGPPPAPGWYYVPPPRAYGWGPPPPRHWGPAPAPSVYFGFRF